MLAERARAKALTPGALVNEPEAERAAASSCAGLMLRRLDTNSSATSRAYAAFSTCARLVSCPRAATFFDFT